MPLGLARVPGGSIFIAADTEQPPGEDHYVFWFDVPNEVLRLLAISARGRNNPAQYNGAREHCDPQTGQILNESAGTKEILVHGWAAAQVANAAQPGSPDWLPVGRSGFASDANNPISVNSLPGLWFVQTVRVESVSLDQAHSLFFDAAQRLSVGRDLGRRAAARVHIEDDPGMPHLRMDNAAGTLAWDTWVAPTGTVAPGAVYTFPARWQGELFVYCTDGGQAAKAILNGGDPPSLLAGSSPIYQCKPNPDSDHVGLYVQDGHLQLLNNFTVQRTFHWKVDGEAV